MGLIKAESSPAVVQFQWRDLEADAREMVADAERRGEAIVREAKVSAEALRESARLEGFGRGHEDGFAQGQEEGCRAAIEQYSQQIELTIAALHDAVGQAVAIKETMRDDAIGDMVELALAIARRVRFIRRSGRCCRRRCRSWKWNGRRWGRHRLSRMRRSRRAGAGYSPNTGRLTPICIRSSIAWSPI